MSRPLTPETLVYGLSAALDPRVSPDGRRLVYTVAETARDTGKVQTHLWLSDLDGANRRRLTQQGQVNAGGRWSPDGRQIAFVSDRTGKSGLFVLTLEAGEPRLITERRAPIGELAWSPDGTRLAFTSPVDPEVADDAEPDPKAPPKVRVTRRIDYKQDGRGFLGDVRAQLFVVDVASGERRQLTARSVDHHFPVWSPDGRTIALLLPNRNGICAQLGLIDVASGEATTIGPEAGTISVWSWSPSGDRLLFAGDTRQSWQPDFFLHDVASGATRRLTDDLPVLPEAGFPSYASPSQPVWLDERRVLFHGFRAGGSGLYLLDVETGGLETLQTWQAQHAGLSCDAAARVVVQGHSSLEAVGEIAVYDRERGETRIVTRQNEAVFAELPPAQWERFDVERGGLTIEAWLLKPRDFDPAKRYPLIIDVHGGPNWYYGYSFDAIRQCLATHGVLVVHANPRGSTSYGRDFTQRVTGDWGGEDFRDLMAVVDAVCERPYVDPARTGIYGYSYGGYMTAWTIGQTDRFRAAACGAPAFNLTSIFGTSDISHHFGKLQWGGAPHEARDWYLAHSPSTFAHRARTPTLIVHGEADERCPIGQGEELFVALHEAGREVEFVRYPGASHLFLFAGLPAHREDLIRRILGWFQDRLGGPESS